MTDTKTAPKTTTSGANADVAAGVAQYLVGHPGRLRDAHDEPTVGHGREARVKLLEARFLDHQPRPKRWEATSREYSRECCPTHFLPSLHAQ